MEALVHAMLSNALVATILALPPLVLARFGRSPALVHSLWLVVLLKLVTPPLVTIPLPDFARVRQDSDSNPVAQYRETMAGLQFHFHFHGRGNDRIGIRYHGRRVGSQ